MTLIVVKLLERTFSWIIFLAPSLQKFPVTNVVSLTAAPSPRTLALASTENGVDWTLGFYYHYRLEKLNTGMLWWEIFGVVGLFSFFPPAGSKQSITFKAYRKSIRFHLLHLPCSQGKFKTVLWQNISNLGINTFLLKSEIFNKNSLR